MTVNANDDAVVSKSNSSDGATVLVGSEYESQRFGHLSIVLPWINSLLSPNHTNCCGSGGSATAVQAIDDIESSRSDWIVETATWATGQALGGIRKKIGRTAAAPAVRELVEAYLLALRDVLCVGPSPRSSELGTDIHQYVCEAVHQQIELYYILHALRTAHGRAVEYLTGLRGCPDEIYPLAARGALSAELAIAFVDGFSAKISRIYVAEEERWASGSSAVRLRIVKDVLAGRSVDQAHVQRVLGIDLARHHLSAVLWAQPGSAAAAYVNRVAAELARVWGAERPLIVPVTPAKTWMWTSWDQPPAADLVAGARERLSPPSGVRVSIGPMAPGLTGFKRSHFGAQTAEQLGGDWCASWLRSYADVAIVSLLINDPLQAGWFVEETLGPLGQPGSRFAELRETLRVYLASERSRVRAAEILHVARNTVAYRVEKAVNLLGRPIRGDSLQLRLALEIARVQSVKPDSDVAPC